MKENQTCLVLGANGFIGSQLVKKLAGLGYKVKAFDRYSSSPRWQTEDLESEVELIRGDFANLRDLEKACKDVTYIFHFIWLSTPAFSSDNVYYELDTNLKYTSALLDLAVKEKVKKVIFASSGGAVYGNNGDTPSTEECLTSPVSTYGLGKLMAEKLMSFTMKTMILRL